MQYHQYHIENELMHQKDAILAAINDERYEEATLLLNFVAELWFKVDYGYKFYELRQRILDALRRLERDADHHATVAKWQRVYQTVTERLNLPKAA